VLGIIEGLTEFLPVSSTGHMVIAMPALGIDEERLPWRALLWVVQFAAILAVVVYFGRDLWRKTFHPISRGWQNHLLAKLAAAMIPTVAGALLFKRYTDRLETMPVVVAIVLILGAGVIEWIDRRFRRSGPMRLEDVTIPQAFLIGLIQCISMIPGVSRAGATIMGGMVLGLTPRVATEFSFYLAIPTMLGALLYSLIRHGPEINGEHTALILIGSSVAFLVALAVVAGFLEFVKRYRFTVFVVYRVILGVAVIAWYLANR
jgi:undecaprenyl-diphosphatase